MRPYPTTSQPDMVRQVGTGKNFPGDAMKRGYVTVNLGSDFDASTIKKGDPVYVVVSTDESIKVPLGGFMSTSVSGKNVVLTNAEFTGAGDAKRQCRNFLEDLRNRRMITFDQATVDSSGAFLIGELERLDQTLNLPLGVHLDPRYSVA
ncbi:putative phage related protein [Escherichia coli]|nr:putative phage related protein [Escherichia coli]